MNIFKQHTERSLAPAFAQQHPLRCHSQVMLGSPSHGCTGAGICKIYMFLPQTPIKCALVSAWLSSQEGGAIRISFLKSTLNNDYLTRHFRWHLFHVPEAFILPDWIHQKLLLTQLEISPGTYPVWDTEEALIVDF